MALPELPARLRYLKEAAHLLAGTAPTTSRHLKSNSNTIMLESDIELLEAERRQACTACGTLMMLDRKSSIQLEPQTRRDTKRTLSKQAITKDKFMIFTCGACGGRTRQRVRSKAMRPTGNLKDRQNASKSSQQTSTGPSSTIVKTLPASNASSKKRAKARRGGLETLANKREADAQGNGTQLDLLDLMKKP